MVVGTCGCLSQTKPRPRKVCLVHGHSEPYSAKQHTWNLWSATKKNCITKDMPYFPPAPAREGPVRPCEKKFWSTAVVHFLRVCLRWQWAIHSSSDGKMLPFCSPKDRPRIWMVSSQTVYHWRSKSKTMDLRASKRAGSTTILEHHIPEKRHVCLPASWAHFIAIHVHKTIETF